MSARRVTGLFQGLTHSLSLCVLAAPAWEQGPADAAARALVEQRRAEERLQQQRDALTPHTVPPGVREAMPPPLHWPERESPCFVIREIALTGEGSHRFGFAIEDLVAGDDRATDRCLGARGIGVVAERAQRALLARGLVTSRVLVPPQQLDAGRLELALLPGRVRTVRFAEGTDLRATARNALPVNAGDILDLRDIEQGLENFRRLPSVAADIVIEPAQEPGQSDLLIAWRQPNPWRVQLALDDSGTRGTGRYQGRVTVHYDHWWTLNDLLYVSLSHDLGGGEPGQRGTSSETVHYSLPWGHWVLGLTASSSRYHQNVAGPYEVFRYSGLSDDAELSLSRLLRRDARSKTSLSLKAWARRSRNHIDDTELEPQRRATGGWELGITHHQAFAAATLDVQLTHRRGTGAFHALPAPEEDFGEGTSRMRVSRLDLQLKGRRSPTPTPRSTRASWCASNPAETPRWPARWCVRTGCRRTWAVICASRACRTGLATRSAAARRAAA